MRCINCGNEVREDSSFCNNCGFNLSGTNTIEAKYENNDKKSSILFWLLLVVSLLTIVFCFLPYFSVLNIKSNYVFLDLGYGELDIKDGIFVVSFSVISILLLIFKKKVPVLLFQIASLVIFIIDYVSDRDKTRELFKYEIGFYLVLVAIIVGIILALLRVVLKNKYK